jgi:hypothetical protein
MERNKYNVFLRQKKFSIDASEFPAGPLQDMVPKYNHPVFNKNPSATPVLPNP